MYFIFYANISKHSSSTLLFPEQGFSNSRAIHNFAGLVVLIKTMNYACMMHIEQTVICVACTYNQLEVILRIAEVTSQKLATRKPLNCGWIVKHLDWTTRRNTFNLARMCLHEGVMQQEQVWKAEQQVLRYQCLHHRHLTIHASCSLAPWMSSPLMKKFTQSAASGLVWFKRGLVCVSCSFGASTLKCSYQALSTDLN